MEDKLSSLYEQIKERKISREDALTMIKELRQNRIPSPSVYASHGIYKYNEHWLKDHLVGGKQILIGAMLGSLAVSTFYKFFPEEKNVHLSNLVFLNSIEVAKDQQVEVLVDPLLKDDLIDFKILFSNDESSKWNLAATGKLKKAKIQDQTINIDTLKNRLERFSNINEIYSLSHDIYWGDTYKNIEQLYLGKDQVLAKLILNNKFGTDKYILNPHIINSTILASLPLINSLGISDPFLPFGINDLYFERIDELNHWWIKLKLVKMSEEMIIFDADFINDQDRIVGQIKGLSIKLIKSILQSDENSRIIESQHEEHNYDTDKMRDSIQKYLINKLCSVINNTKSFKIDENLMNQGIESSQLVAVANEIEKDTNVHLNPTVFFEYPNIKEITEYFISEHSDSFHQLFAVNDKEPVHFKSKTSAKTTVSTAKKDSPQHTEFFTPRTTTLSNDIAVIGVHGIFPKASNLDEFWKDLCNKKDVIEEIPVDHWDYNPWYDPNPEAPNKTYCKWGSFIDHVDKFDADFFNISPREAKWMDPQLRLLLQSVYSTGEDAGCINELRGSNTGVFIGVCFHDYKDKITELNLPIDPYIGMGNAHTVISNRISFFLNLTGPSLTIDTACSSSLFALHLACNALRNKECNMAIVGGANLLLSSWHYRYFSSIRALSPTGRSHTFDEAADGYVPGECIGSMLLKPLQQAQLDGDHIYAVIKGSAGLHGGYTPSLIAPSVAGEENVIVKAWENAGINPETISYIEAHGTGTKIGDPIETSSLIKAFRRFTNKENFCAIGSSKANIGHTEGAAGIAGVLKVIMQMKQGQIPALPMFKKLNPYINLDKSPLYINPELEEWKTPPGVPRRAGVSSFGFSGAFSHIVIEEYKAQNLEELPTSNSHLLPALFVLSAKNKERLKEMAQLWLKEIEKKRFIDEDLLNIAYTLQIGREAMNERLALTVRSIKELEEKLKGFVFDNNNFEEVYSGQVDSDNEIMSVFASDKDMMECVNKWIENGRYTNLMKLWVKGLNIDWNKFYGDHKPNKTSLPTYSFAQESYWISSNEMGNNQVIVEQQTLAEEPKKTKNKNNNILQNIQEYLIKIISNELHLNREKIKLNLEFQNYGVDSIITIKLIRNIENKFNIRFSGREIMEYRTIEALSNNLAAKIDQGAVSTEIFQEPLNGEVEFQEPIDNETIEVLEKYIQKKLSLQEVNNLIGGGEL